MSYGLLLIVAALSCVSARFTVPVPVHYEVEAQFQKQTGTKMRWDPTNYLTYLAAVYSQCGHLYTGGSLQQRGRVSNATAYGNLLTYFDSSLLPNNLAVFSWDVASDDSQDAGTVDRDIRKLFGKSNGVGALGNIANIDSNLRSYDRFGCSIETTCKSAQTAVMTLVCVFGQTTTPRQVSGTGGSQAAAAATTRAAVTRAAATTTRARARVTTAARVSAGGFYETYSRDSEDYYSVIVNDFPAPDSVSNYKSAEVVPFEQKLTALGLCKFENNPNALTADLLQGFDADVQVTLYSASPSPFPSSQDMSASPMSNAAKNALREVMGNKVGSDLTVGQSVACSWALCSQKVLAACAVWGPAADYQEQNYE